MQVEPSNFSSSSPLSSLVAPSHPSVDPAPAAGARAKVTYSRKPVVSEDTHSALDSSSSSQPTSPSDHLFDTPMRSYGRDPALRSRRDSADHDANDVTTTTDVSPATTAHAANSAIKAGPSSLFRRIDSHPSQHSDDSDQDDQSPKPSPAANRTKKFQLGMARAIFDSDSESDSDGARSNATSRTADKSSTGNDDQDNGTVIARIRAQAARDPDSDPFTGSLSSVPPSSSQALSSLQRSSLQSGDEAVSDDDQDGSITITRRRGAKIAAMRGRGAKSKRSKFDSSSDKEPSAAFEDQDQAHSRKARTFKLASSASSASAVPTDDNDADQAPSSVNVAPSRREKMEALAAKARKAHGQAHADVVPEADPLLDAFFGGASPGNIPSRSPSLDIQGSDEDEHNDAMPAFMAPQSKAPIAKPKSKKPKSVAVERDILSDLEDEFDHANAKAASKRAAPPREKAPPKVKPLSKKELETMHRQTARLARENRTRLAPTHHKKTIGLNDLLNKINAREHRNADQVAGASSSTDSAAVENCPLTSSSQPSSHIPSGQSKSQHASDPIESDPIPERSSPHSNYVSSPIVPVSRQQERRLGLDQSTSSASILQTTAGRVAGLATKPDEAANFHRLLASADNEDDAQLPDLASIVKNSHDQQEAAKEVARKQQRLREMKLRFLERSRQQPQPSEAVAPAEKRADRKLGQADADDDDELVLYHAGAVLASKHNLPTTPSRKRPTDLLYREIGIRPGKTPNGRKTYAGTNANGSPNAALLSGGNVDNQEDQDELVVTDSQLRNAGKGLFIASDQAAGHIPVVQPQPASTQAQQDEANVHASSTQRYAGPLKMTQAQLNATLMRKMQTQSLKARSQKESKDAGAKASTGPNADKHSRSAAPDVRDMLERLKASVDVEGRGQIRGQDAGEDEDDPDFIMPPARDAESVIGSDVDMGSASEIEAADDMGSAEEDEDVENQDVEQAGPRDTIEEADEEHDSEKENAPPVSQQSIRSNASPSLNRNVLPSRAVLDDDEDELPAPRAHVRRGRRSALADDEGDDEADENPLQPGPFDRSRGNTHTDEAAQKPGRARVPLGDISSQSIDQSMLFSRSNTSSPTIQHAFPPGGDAPARRGSPISPPTAGQDEEESFRTDDIPSQAADLGRFFEPTLPPPSVAKSTNAASHAPKSFWDQTQTQTQSQSQDPSQLLSSVRPPPADTAPRQLVRDESANSALGAFFQDTQQDELRGESLDIFENPKNVGGKAHGFTQLFDGTPPSSAAGRGTAVVTTEQPSAWDASTMPPPKSTEVDAFAALRKAQMGEAMDLLDPTPSVLPSFDESQAEREAYAQAQADSRVANLSPEKMYMNRDGFFTQTKPSQQLGLWSQYDSQGQSQSQHASASGAGGVWPSPAAPRGSARRGSDVSNVSNRKDAFILDDDEDQPVQLKRLRRGGTHSGEAESNEHEERDRHQSDAESEIDENGPPSSQPEPRPRNAFDVLRQGPIASDLDESASKGKKRKSAFIEGEAEESEDEELGGRSRGDGGGLKGIFGDDNGSISGADDDEDDDEDDANAADLQELVDNERELDEAEKDEVARARFREDMEAKDREDLEIHQKAIQGGYRNRRGRTGLNGLDEYLDGDASLEEDKRKVAMMSTAAWKKRKLLDGTEDGMDALAAHEEAQAFVKSYAATHRIDHESENYNFLAIAEVDKDDDDSSDDEAEIKEDENEEDEEDERQMDDEDMEEDAFGPVVTKQPKKIRYDDVRAAIRERRKAKLRGLFDDDEAENENDWNSDEDDTEARLAAAMHDRIKGVSTQRVTTQAGAAALQAKRKPQPALQYGRKQARTCPTSDDVESMEVDTQDTPDAEADDADDDTTGSLMARLLSRPTPRPTAFRSGSSMTMDTLEDAEPEWGNDANLMRAPKPAAGTSQSSSGSRVSNSGLKAGSSPFGGKAPENKRAKAGGSMLLKQGIMRRESGFSSST